MKLILDKMIISLFPNFSSIITKVHKIVNNNNIIIKIIYFGVYAVHIYNLFVPIGYKNALLPERFMLVIKIDERGS